MPSFTNLLIREVSEVIVGRILINNSLNYNPTHVQPPFQLAHQTMSENPGFMSGGGVRQGNPDYADY